MRFLRESLILVVLAFVFSLLHFEFFIKHSKPDYYIDPERAFSLLGRAIFIDAREFDDYSREHIPLAYNISFDRIEFFTDLLESLPPDTPLIIYSDTLREELALDLYYLLKERGFKNLHVLHGGIEGWKASGLPLQ